jgi:ABC-type iron transport system FetAB permease component
MSSPTLAWINVLIGLLFIIFDALLSLVLGLGIGSSLVIAAIRSVVQLTIMGLVLDKVFASDTIWGVIGIAREWSAELCRGRVSSLAMDIGAGRSRMA